MEKKFESGAAITSVYCYEVEIKNPNGGKETVFIYPEDIAD